jgi:hypothetical protein
MFHTLQSVEQPASKFTTETAPAASDRSAAARLPPPQESRRICPLGAFGLVGAHFRKTTPPAAGSGALICTVIGLLVAIPAMFAYNFMVTRVRAITQQLDDFGSELATHLEHTFVDARAESVAPAEPEPAPVAHAAAPTAAPAPAGLFAAVEPTLGR